MGDTVKGASDIAANLDTVIDETSEVSPTQETEQTDVAGSPESTKGSKTIPYTRFKEVIDSKNTLQEQLEALQDKYETQSTSLGKLTEMLEKSKQDSDLIREIQALQHDPKMLPHLEAIDKKIRGIEEEIEETGNVDDKKVEQVQRLIAKQKAELDERFMDQQSDILVQKADTIADRWLEALPEDYSDQDKAIISKLWANEVDWNNIEQDPDSLSDVLKTSFQTVINDYGIPRGRLIDPNDPDSYEIEMDEPEVKSPVEELMEAIGRKDYGKIKESDTGGRKTVQAEISDDEFTRDMAKVLRSSRS